MDASSTRPLVIGLPITVKHAIEGRLPANSETRYFDNWQEAVEQAKGIEIGWFDFRAGVGPGKIYHAAQDLKWVHTVGSGIEHLPFDEFRRRGIRMTNSVGLNATVVAEYAVMGVLVGAKRFDEVLRAHDRGEWLKDAPGKIEMEGSRALVLGYGKIGQAIVHRLRAFGVIVDAVRANPAPGEDILGPNDWQASAGDYDFIVVAAPSTPKTKAMVDADVIARMKPTAWLVNIARGPLIAREPLIEALRDHRIGGAFLDVTDPEPLTPGDPLWKMPNTIITMHLSGRSQTKLFDRGADFFLGNLDRYLKGEKMVNEIDFTRGY